MLTVASHCDPTTGQHRCMMTHPHPLSPALLPPLLLAIHQVYRRVELGPGVESYDLIGSFDKEPTPTLITDAFRAAWDRD